jgi:hypothetical protein
VGKTACDGGASLVYPSLAVNVSVSWPRMGQVKPVVSNTVLTPPKNTLASNMSFVGVKVVDVLNAPVSGQLVTLSGPGTFTDTTSADGCAVFPLTASQLGTYTASVVSGGVSVDMTGQTAPTVSVPVPTSGTLVQKQFSYDKAATFAVTLVTDLTYNLPVTKPQISLYNVGIPPLGVKTVASGGITTIVPSLWPYTDGYAFWAGSCKQSDPIAAAPSPAVPLGVRQQTGPLLPGALPAATIRLAPVQVAVTRGGSPLGSATVMATQPSPATNCAVADNPLTLGTTDPITGVLMTSLPAGKWILTVVGKSGSLTTGTLLQTTAATSYALVVT